jgi:hypothetical protein
MAIYNNDRDPNVKQWEQEQTQPQPSEKYKLWWEQNKERILEQDQLNHDMQFKTAYIKQGNY